MITRGSSSVALRPHVPQGLVRPVRQKSLRLAHFCVTTCRTTVCNAVGSSLKAVDVKTEDASEDVAHLDAFCVKDKGQ